MKSQISVVNLMLLLIFAPFAASQSNFDEPIIIDTVRGATHIIAADLDSDDDLDVLSASANDNTVAWYENEDSQGSFGSQQTITTDAQGARRVAVADLDGDGDLDVLSASYNDSKIAWYENMDGQGSFSSEKVISLDAVGALFVVAADLDSDGDMDVLSVAWDLDQVDWYENTDGQGTFGSSQLIAANVDGAVSAYAADLDNDSDMDVIVGSNMNNEISWYANSDGLGHFSIQQVITVDVQNLMNVIGADLDNDGDIDVLSASSDDDKVAWYVNRDGQGDFGEQQVIASDATDAFTVAAADMDSDGDLDVLWGASRANTIVWQENQHGFGPGQIITTDARGVESVYAADLDNDGDQDVLSANWGDGHLAWYQNNR